MRLLGYRLAVAMGELDVDALLDRMSPQQLAEWMAYDQVEPIRHDMKMLAMLVNVVSSTLGGPVNTPEFSNTVTPWLIPESEDDADAIRRGR